MQMPRWLLVTLIMVFVLWVANQPLVSIAVDWLWFDSIGYLSIFQTTLAAQVGMWFTGLLVAGGFLTFNVWLAAREEPIDVRRLSLLLTDLGLTPEQLQNLIRGLLAVSIGLPALIFAGAAANQWLTLLSFLNREPFGRTETVFNNDISFYVFELPFWEFLQWMGAGIVLMSLLVAGGYYVARDVFINRDEPVLSPRARVHLLSLAGLLFLTFGLDWWLMSYELLFDKGADEVVWGAGYTDINARIPGFRIMAGASLLVSIALIASTLQRSWRLTTIGLVLYAVARVLIASVWPDIMQDYFVKPNELEWEREYLSANIESTNQAYALDRIEVKPFEAEAGLTMKAVDENPLTIENIRVWDTRPLLTTYGQIQEIRTYYDFKDVDVDRYMFDGQPRQVMLSGRELNYANVDPQARSWVNEHFQYTHGYGLTMSPVNVVTPEGLPALFVKDLPPEAVGIDLPINRPEIYYGELTNTYVMVNSGTEEFDYPAGDENVYTTYAGKGGVPIGQLWQQAIFAMHFSSLDILLSQYILPETRVMFRRTISDRVSRLAPFLSFDQDPYLVVADGKMYWMIDAYTTTRFIPYSEPQRLERSRVNYIRNSVKVVVDAYNGSVDFYIADDDDPLIQVYANIFEDSFKPLSAMPASLQDHIRYPSDFFDRQAEMYRAYHMKDPTVFYNKEDMWAIPRELYAGQEQPMDSYYLIMKLPSAEEAEFILLLPFVPRGKDNMISWLAARCDKENYGNLVLYQFPKQKLIYGPRQIEARIDQNPEISEMITLWSQAGSRVVRGNLLVIPIGNSLMYVEPLYLQAESSQLPELKRVIVSYENRIAMRQTLDEALRAVFAPDDTEPVDSTSSMRSERNQRDTDPDTEPAVVAGTPGWSVLASRAHRQLERALRLQRDGDWAGYGESLDGLEKTLNELLSEADAATPDAAPEYPSDEAPAPEGAPE
ncbi:MAG: UPF0182 family protein [Myxococcota bacterium]